ncbi:ribosomal L28e protein family-domain-containing protein [Crassisporium funariophilum]|nr:ribosomal L28e protein family-domain-containing protein [Crassisporium funariophilum]
MSNDLQWLLLRKNNSFMVKRVVEGPIFSKEPGNLRNVHSFKFSGLANSKVIDVADSGSGLRIRTRKTKASPQAVAPAYATASVRPRSGVRRALGIASSTAKRGYRPDLRTVSFTVPAHSNSIFLSRFFGSFLSLSLRNLVRTHWNC